MKVLIIQENGRHTENRKFRECLNFSRAFERNGIEAIVWGLGHQNFSIPFDEIIKGVDVIFLLENYEVDGWIPDLSSYSIYKVFLSIDSHCILHAHTNTVKKHKVNLVLNAIESHQVHFTDVETIYYPNAYPSDLIYPIPDIKKETFIGFCGRNFDDRMSAIKRLEERFNIEVPKHIWILGDDMVKAINSFKIHYNRTVGVDINYRVFETMGCNTLSLTNETENISKLFTDMENIVIYKNEEDMYDKITFLMNNPDEIVRISQNGYEHVKTYHTFDNRAKELVDILKSRI